MTRKKEPFGSFRIFRYFTLQLNMFDHSPL